MSGRGVYPDWYRLAIYGLILFVFILIMVISASLLFSSTYSSVLMENSSVNGSLPSKILAIRSPVFIYGIPVISILFIYVIFVIFAIVIILVVIYLARRTGRTVTVS